MNSKPKLTGLGIALGAALGAAFGVAAGHMAVWLAVGVAVGMALGSTLHRKSAACPMCEEVHSTHAAAERNDAK
ncbi:MAG: hypothetical protein ACRD3B_02240 [Candidatus Sulfotelmatobacter sp.]